MMRTWKLLAILLLPNLVFAQANPGAEQKLQTFFKYVELAYVDSVDANKLAEDAIVAILEDLDPHSTYISAKDLQKMNEPLEGKFEGVGIQFNILKDTITVVTPIAGGPSEKLGIQSGDKIITIDSKTVAGVGFKNKDVMESLRGEKGTKVTVEIKRRGSKELLEFTITRDKIPIYSVDASYMATNEIGYIKLNRFAATSMGEIHLAMDSLQGEGMNSLILDLRGNGGGYLQTAIELADEFLGKDKMIVYTQGRSFPRDDTYSSKKGDFEKGKLVILIDEGSASASEIVTGAVQDWDRGLVIGRRSFGKGLVQKPFSLPDGSVIRLTVSRYYTPSGRSIQKPYDEGMEAYYNDLNERYKHGEYSNKDSIQFPDSLKYTTKVEGRTVYGGGGIMPDIFIPLDTTRGSTYYGKLVRKGHLNNFALTYVDNHRDELTNNYTNIADFIANFDQDGTVYNELIEFAENEGLEKDEEGLEKSEDLIEINLRALIARGIYGSGAFYQVTNSEDEAFETAIKAIEDKETFKKYKINDK